jgi:Fe2+ or Zn2+ uptake regulation protein
MCQGTVSPRPALSAAEIAAERQRLRTALNEGGHGATARRLAIYDILLETNDHICVEHILEHLTEQHPTWSVNKTTVYRTLNLLLELGFVYEMRHDDGRAQYELALHGPHGHILCTACGQLQDLDPPSPRPPPTPCAPNRALTST